MRILITGSRHWINYRVIQQLITEKAELANDVGDTLYVRHGDCPSGADRLAKLVVWGYNNANDGLDVVEEAFPAKWDELGKAAGMIRNQEMLDTEPLPVDEVHAFPLQDSKGTVGMMKIAAAQGIPVFNYGWPGFNDQISSVIQVTRSLYS